MVSDASTDISALASAKRDQKYFLTKGGQRRPPTFAEQPSWSPCGMAWRPAVSMRIRKYCTDRLNISWLMLCEAINLAQHNRAAKSRHLREATFGTNHYGTTAVDCFSVCLDRRGFVHNNASSSSATSTHLARVLRAPPENSFIQKRPPTLESYLDGFCDNPILSRQPNPSTSTHLTHVLRAPP